LFTTPKLLEALGEKINLFEAGIRGVFCGGTTMTPQHVRFLIEEVLENRIGFYPTYGNTLMGLAASVPLRPEDNFSITYYAPQPAPFGVWSTRSITANSSTMGMGPRRIDYPDREFFMPRFLERDEAILRAPRGPYAWDGVAEVRPFGAMEKTIVEAFIELSSNNRWIAPRSVMSAPRRCLSKSCRLNRPPEPRPVTRTAPRFTRYPP